MQRLDAVDKNAAPHSKTKKAGKNIKSKAIDSKTTDLNKGDRSFLTKSIDDSKVLKPMVNLGQNKSYINATTLRSFYGSSHFFGIVQEGLRIVGRDRPSNPIKFLGDYLIEKGNEIEGSKNDKKDQDRSDLFNRSDEF